MQFIGFIFIDFVERIWFLKFVIFKPEKNSILAEAVSHSVHGLSKQTPSQHHHIMGFTSCSVESCTNTNKNSSEKFFRFPQDNRRTKWIEFTAKAPWKKWQPKADSRICGCHFPAFQIKGKNLASDAMPLSPTELAKINSENG